MMCVMMWTALPPLNVKRTQPDFLVCKVTTLHLFSLIELQVKFEQVNKIIWTPYVKVLDIQSLFRNELNANITC